MWDFFLVLIFIVGAFIAIDQLLIKRGVFVDCAEWFIKIKYSFYALAFALFGFGALYFGIDSALMSYDFVAHGVSQRALVLEDIEKKRRSRKRAWTEHELTIQFDKQEEQYGSEIPVGVTTIRVKSYLSPGTMAHVYRIPYTDKCSTTNDFDYSVLVLIGVGGGAFLLSYGYLKKIYDLRKKSQEHGKV